MGEPHVLELEAARIDDLASIRAFVHARASSLGASAGAADDLVIALDEAATNALRHGYAGRPGRLRIECLREGGELVVHLTDEAPPFDPTGCPEPDLEVPLDRRPFGGMGIHLMRTSVDRLVYRRVEPAWNELTFVKELGPQERRTAP